MSHTFRSRAVVLPDGVRPASVHAQDGIITAVRAYDAAAEGELVDAGDALLLPGLVDVHVHLNEPGRAEWEGFESGTAAAAAGGVTTVIDMPLNSVPATTTLAALAQKRAAAAGKCAVDVGFWGGVVPGNAGELESLWDAGVCGFKCFLVPSGVDEFEHVTERELRTALPVLARLGAPLLVHAELPELIGGPDGDTGAYESYLRSRPDRAEVEAVALVMRLAQQYDARVHIVHVSSAETLAVIRSARAAGVAVTAETCPHYLTFGAEDVRRGATELKCAPPIRDGANRERLWQGLRAGELDLVASDHSPAPPSLKDAHGDWFRAWGGIASLQLGLPVMWSGARARDVGIGDIVRWMAVQPARLANIGKRKGAIEPGRDADLVVFDPDVEWAVDAAALQHRHAITPYHGMSLRGRVIATYLRGEPAFANDAPAAPRRGRCIERQPND